MGLFKNLTSSTKSASSSVVDVPVKSSKKSASGKSKKVTSKDVEFPKYPVLQLQMHRI